MLNFGKANDEVKNDYKWWAYGQSKNFALKVMLLKGSKLNTSFCFSGYPKLL